MLKIRSRAFIVILKGGLGNQIFQISLARLIKKRYPNAIIFLLDATRCFDKVHSSHVKAFFSDSSSPISRFIYAYICLFGKVLALFPSGFFCYHDSSSFESDPTLSETSFLTIFNGYWQNLQIAQNIVPELYSQLNSTFPGSSLRYLYDGNRRFDKCRPTVAVHIRRGDFFSSSKNLHSVCTPIWYKLALSKIQEKCKIFNTVVFSDDPAWVVSSGIFDSDVCVFSEPIPDEQVIAYMHTADHFVLSNSTFGYWAALLAEYRNSRHSLVVAPFYWLRGVRANTLDLLPSNWLLLE